MTADTKILLDIEEKSPVLDFDKYVETACNLIKNSEPRFSIGIFGEWGTGKTTLMKGIKNKLQDQSDLTTVWFNAWRYENEQYHATIPLLKSIAYSIETNDEFKETSNKIKKAMPIITKNVFDGILTKFSGVSLSKIIDEINCGMEDLSKLEKGTIHYDGLLNVSKELKDSNKKIIVFIDDLDRCSPEKTIQVLESMKAFLDIWGIVFVIGLSYNTTANLITEKYGGNIKGEDYIKKIIQVPLFVQDWNNTDILEMTYNISKRLSDDYKCLIQKNLEMIILVLEKNPREVKRFLNSFIISNEIYFKNDVEKSNNFLIINAFKWRWSKEYGLFSQDKEFRDHVKELYSLEPSGLDNILSKKIIDERKPKKIHSSQYFEDIKQLFADKDFLAFIKYIESLFEIDNWEDYRRASFASSKQERDNKKLPSNSELVSILKKDVGEFNKLRIDLKFEHIDLKSANLRGADLKSANLRGTNLSGADLKDANLVDANLKSANLVDADLSGADLKSADLSGAKLKSANLVNTDLSGAKLKSANLVDAYLKSANLKNANLSGVDLSGADLVDADLKSADLVDADLSGADLSGADLKSANLVDAYLKSADLKSADLKSADLSGANLVDADLSGADLRGADLKSANLVDADLSGADLVDANLSGANLKSAKKSRES